MVEKKGFVIAFHNDEEKHPYWGLACRDEAIRSLKQNLATKFALRARNGGERDSFPLASIESKLSGRDLEALATVERKVRRGESIFLDFKESDARAHNESDYAQLFLIASIHVTPEHFSFLNPELFSKEDREEIIDIVNRSQNEKLYYLEVRAVSAV